MNRSVCLVMLVNLLMLAVPPAFTQTFDISWSTIDGGGVQASTGGGWELSGTIGQPDAGTAMTGGAWTLTGGFWPGAPAGPAICAGDTNCDGSVSYADINPFIKALGSLTAWQTQYPSCPWQNLDMNVDGNVNYADINPFIARLGSPGPCP